jgi:hypothetical protein
MKKLLLVCAFVIGVSAVSFAQGRQQQTPAQQLDRLKTAVTGITDDQATKITAIYTTSAKSMDSLRTAANGDRDAMREKMMPMRAATNAKIKAVLTADQAKQFDAMPQRGRGGNGGGGGGGN